jgi:hypothetical protein
MKESEHLLCGEDVVSHTGRNQNKNAKHSMAVLYSQQCIEHGLHVGEREDVVADPGQTIS